MGVESRAFLNPVSFGAMSDRETNAISPATGGRRMPKGFVAFESIPFRWLIGSLLCFFVGMQGQNLLRSLRAWELTKSELALGYVNLAVAVPMFFVGIWACGVTGRHLGAADHGSMVWDEVVAFLPLAAAAGASIWMQLVAFGIFRGFDILKPPPIKYFETNLKGGLGVMFDDLIAASYTFAVLIVLVFGGRALLRHPFAGRSRSCRGIAIPPRAGRRSFVSGVPIPPGSRRTRPHL
jgi:phosphatidylglycerophosphatase A